MAEWYVQVDGKKYGPFDSEKLVKLAAAGKLTPTDRVRKGHDGQWKPASSVRRLFDAETQTTYRSSKQGSSSKTRTAQPAAKKLVSQKHASQCPNEKRPAPAKTKATKLNAAAPADPLFDLSEAFGADASAPLAPIKAPTKAKQKQFAGLDDAVGANETLAAKTAQWSWWLPFVVVPMSKIVAQAAREGHLPLGVFYGVILLIMFGFVMSLFALAHIPKQGTRRILLPAAAGLIFNGSFLVIVGVGVVDGLAAIEDRETPATRFEQSKARSIERQRARESAVPSPETHFGDRSDARSNPPEPGDVVPNPFRPKDDVSDNPFEPSAEVENPFEPKDEPQNPFEPAGDSDNPFEPATEPENPFEPAAEPENPFE